MILVEQQTKLKIALVAIDELKPHEKGSPLYLELIKHEICKDEVLKYPIIADEKTGVILDGMHRWLALKSLGYSLIPVILVDAFQKPEIHVGKKRIHRYINDSNGEIPIESVIESGLSGCLMETRSTRHFFPFSKFQRINCPLHSLQRRAPQDVSMYLDGLSRDKDEEAVKEWLSEINEELDFLAKRREEVERELREYLNRIKNSSYRIPDFNGFL